MHFLYLKKSQINIQMELKSPLAFLEILVLLVQAVTVVTIIK